MIEDRILQVSTGELSLTVREEQRELHWSRLKDFHHLIRAQTV